jgi:hypothetical protein
LSSAHFAASFAFPDKSVKCYSFRLWGFEIDLGTPPLHQRSSLTPSKEVMLVASYKKEAMHSAGRSAIQQYIARSLGDHFDPPPPREGRHGLSNSQGGIKAIPQLTGSACPAPLLATASSHTPLPRRCRSS